MAKTELKLKARELRSEGESVKEIASKLGVAKSTASLWVRDIILSIEQLESLQKRVIKGGELGRMRGAFKQKKQRLKLVEDAKKAGIKTFKGLSDRELLVAGTALYWGEGSKSKRGVRIYNSDPRLMVFMINWFKRIFGIKTKDFAACVGINEIYRTRDAEVKNYWSEITGIPLNQFRKTSFKKVKNKKVYKNFNDHYGTLMIEILKSARFYYKIMGLIEGLASQGSSMAEQRFHKTKVVGSTPTPGTTSS